MGCAHYSTSGGLVGGIRSLGIPVAQSQAAEVGVAELLSERAVEAYARDGRLRVVDEEGADALLHLRVISLEDRPFTYTAGEQTEQYRFAIAVDAQLLRAADEEVLLEIKGVIGWGTYDAALPDEEGRDRAVERALDMVIEEILDRTTAGW
jgi:hypothetical protein